jgi:hypothetical protein
MGVSPRRVVVALLAGVVLLQVLNLLAKLLGPQFPLIDRLFNLDAEGGVPAWYSQALHLSSAMLCAVIFATLKGEHRRARVPWLIMAVVFTYTSLDELAALHETLVRPMQELTGIRSGALASGWTIPFVLALVVLCLALLRFFISLPRFTRVGLATALVIFVTGAVGMELIFVSLLGFPQEQLAIPLSRILFVTVALEEGMEMIGLCVLIFVLLTHLGRSAPDGVLIAIRSDRPELHADGAIRGV